MAVKLASVGMKAASARAVHLTRGVPLEEPHIQVWIREGFASVRYLPPVSQPRLQPLDQFQCLLSR